MVIVIDDVPLGSIPHTTAEFCQAHPSLVAKGKAFAALEQINVPKEWTLYVSQREYGVVPGTDPSIKVVGTDDATTCHSVVIRHPNGSVAVAHFDGSRHEEKAAYDIVNKLVKIEGNCQNGFELYIAGGYCAKEGSVEAKRRESEKLSLKLLRTFHGHKKTFLLKLWCTCAVNTVLTSKGPSPKVYGLGVEIATGNVFPALFVSHDPDLTLRSAYRWSSSSDKMIDLYDHHTQTITIYPFTRLEYFSFDVSLMSDEHLLEYFSTSPEVEPPHFCDELRGTIQLCVAHPKPHITLFPNNQPRSYKLNSNGHWELKAD
ncbi:protein N-terminal asparagine amidohydrolase-like isoform X1 [Oratosquilla oratoria]|uniref:protein N-terminal asparagine amidohydrolase-like isoform X1 n=1 Tax=Oratosquilla oratoria TaxID=337810 RepID=UPI003F75A7CF